MTISFSCPSCEHRLKVRDELAGRKVKCPSCGGGVAVPADAEDEEAAAATARPSREAREADEDERPRKKKKKKKTSNKGLVIGLVVGGVALVAVTVLVIVLNLPRGQPNKEQVAENPPRKQEPVPQQPVPPPQPHPEQRVAGLANRGEDTAVMNDLRQIGLFYNQYLITNPKGPNSTKAFADEIRRDARHIAEALDKQIYVLLPGVRRGANMIVAYDVPGNSASQHIVLMGDGSVQAMPLQELQQHLKQAGKQ
jgi:hypothetical protein